MTFLNRLFNYQNANRRIPSGPSHIPHDSPAPKVLDSRAPWWERYPEYRGGRFSKIDDEETILEGKVSISLDRGDILVIPEGRLDEVPEKYKCRVVEVPHLFDFSVIS
jgi:hypothetical protein